MVKSTKTSSIRIIMSPPSMFFKPKKTKDHIAFKVSCAPKWYSAVFTHLWWLPNDQIHPEDHPIRMYKSVHTGPKSQFGGVKKGLLRPVYHIGIADCVTLPAIPPIIKQTIMEKSMATLFCFFVFINNRIKYQDTKLRRAYCFLVMHESIIFVPYGEWKRFYWKKRTSSFWFF